MQILARITRDLILLKEGRLTNIQTEKYIRQFSTVCVIGDENPGRAALTGHNRFNTASFSEEVHYINPERRHAWSDLCGFLRDRAEHVVRRHQRG